jgi:RNA polymerase sigma-70 factor, ECF subfamily
MEQITLQKGVYNTPQVAEASSNGYAEQSQQALGALALVPPDSAPSLPPYHRETSPDAVALLHEAQAGNTQAFGELYRQHYGPITRYVAARMRDRDRESIPDLVQDAFCEAFANLPSAPDDVTSWLFRLAAKACTRHDWSNRRYVRAALTIGEEASRTPMQTDDALQAPAHLNRISFAHALARLTPSQRRAIQLRYLEGYPRDQAAELTGRTKDAMRHLEYRALRNLRRVLAWTALEGNGVELLAAGQSTPLRDTEDNK